jgi:hypothetical protein
VDNALAISGAKDIFPLRAPLAVLVDAPTQNSRRALKRNGALFILNGDVLAILCGVENA